MMMKTLKTILITLFVTLSCVACTKDENGNYVKYYKHVTGEGYVFYRYLDGNIAPYANCKVKITAWEDADAGGMSGSIPHGTTITAQTDNKGLYKGIKFAKSFDNYDMNDYIFNTDPRVFYDETNHYKYVANYQSVPTSLIRQKASIASTKSPQIISMDTLFVVQEIY